MWDVNSSLPVHTPSCCHVFTEHLFPHTQYEADHGAEVPGATAQVEEGESGAEVQSLHHLRVDTGSRQVDVPMPPRQVLTTPSIHYNQKSLRL